MIEEQLFLLVALLGLPFLNFPFGKIDLEAVLEPTSGQASVSCVIPVSWDTTQYGFWILKK